MRKPWAGGGHIPSSDHSGWSAAEHCFKFKLSCGKEHLIPDNLKVFLTTLACLGSYDLNILVTLSYINQMSSPVQKVALSFSSKIQITRHQKDVTWPAFHGWE